MCVISSFALSIVFVLICSDARVTREKDRLAAQREQAEEALEEAMARLRRIRKQEQQLREKAAEMVSRGFESLEELEAADRQAETERQAELARVQEEEARLLDSLGPLPTGVDWSSSNVDLGFLDPDLLVSTGGVPSSSS